MVDSMLYNTEPSNTLVVTVVVQWFLNVNLGMPSHTCTHIPLQSTHSHSCFTDFPSHLCKGLPYGHALPPLHVPHLCLVWRWVVGGGGWRRWVHLSTTPECSTLHTSCNTRWIPFKLQCYHWHRHCELIFHEDFAPRGMKCTFCAVSSFKFALKKWIYMQVFRSSILIREGKILQ